MPKESNHRHHEPRQLQKVALLGCPHAWLAPEHEARILTRWPRVARWLLIGLLVFLVGGWSSAERSAQATPADTVSLAPGAPSLLVINQETPDHPAYSDETGHYTEMLLRHFTANTTMIKQDQYADDQLFGFDSVVVVGNDEDTSLPSALLEDLAQTDQPILWLGSGIDQLPVDMATTYGFAPGEVTDKDIPSSVEYSGQRYAVEPDDYHPISVTSPSVQLFATYQGGKTPVPYILRGGNLWYMNESPSAPSDDYPDAGDAPELILADVLHDFFGTSVTESRKAVVRLEDVSVHVDPDQLTQIVDYLYSQQIPFALGLIPAQRFSDGSIVELGERPEFVKALRYAQDHGGTIVLHGYHHTFGSGEDYEFWDIDRNAPLAGETWDTYAWKVENGIRILRDYGIEPRLWETPHYAGSPLAYGVFSHYFSYAIENRDPVGWLPYPSGPDEYGQMIIPEQLGYIAPEEGMTVEAQLERADMLRIVRDSWAVGFFHPVTVSQSEVEQLVSGLRQQGYTFTDLRTIASEVNYDYVPARETHLLSWLEINLGLSSLRRMAWPAVGVLWVGAIVIAQIRRRKIARVK
jgi:hypothetical protein